MKDDSPHRMNGIHPGPWASPVSGAEGLAGLDKACDKHAHIRFRQWGVPREPACLWTKAASAGKFQHSGRRVCSRNSRKGRLTPVASLWHAAQPPTLCNRGLAWCQLWHLKVPSATVKSLKELLAEGKTRSGKRAERLGSIVLLNFNVNITSFVSLVGKMRLLLFRFFFSMYLSARHCELLKNSNHVIIIYFIPNILHTHTKIPNFKKKYIYI